jgi:hypothetical protein
MTPEQFAELAADLNIAPKEAAAAVAPVAPTSSPR